MYRNCLGTQPRRETYGKAGGGPCSCSVPRTTQGDWPALRTQGRHDHSMRPLRPEQTATQSGCCQLVNRGTFIGSSFLAVQTLPPALALGIAAGAEDQRVQRRALVSKAPSPGAARSTPGSEHPKVCPVRPRSRWAPTPQPRGPSRRSVPAWGGLHRAHQGSMAKQDRVAGPASARGAPRRPHPADEGPPRPHAHPHGRLLPFLLDGPRLQVQDPA